MHAQRIPAAAAAAGGGGSPPRTWGYRGRGGLWAAAAGGRREGRVDRSVPTLPDPPPGADGGPFPGRGERAGRGGGEGQDAGR